SFAASATTAVFLWALARSPRSHWLRPVWAFARDGSGARAPWISIVAITALADAQQPGLPTRRCLPRDEPKPGGEVPAASERCAGSDCCDQGSRIQHADAGDGS